jgi:glycosyltransferase involved in cell wall biosynthesis
MRVRYYGHVGQRSGYGRAAEATCLALLSAGVELDIRPLAPAEQLDFTRSEVLPLATCLHRSQSAPFNSDVVIVHTLPFPSSHNLDRIPIDARLEEANGLARAFVLPHAFGGSPQSDASPTSGPFSFYYVGAWNARKNPAGLLRAFASEFNRGDPVALVLHCMGTSEQEFAVAMTATGVPRDDMPPVSFRGDFAPDRAIADLHHGASCFVTATRGEAWNFPAFDAMAAGRFIIAPAAMGHDDYLDARPDGQLRELQTSARLYRGGREQPAMGDVAIAAPIPGQSSRALNLRFTGPQGLDGRSTWLEPDLQQLAAAMRRTLQRKESNLIVNYNPLERYGYEAVGKQLRAHLEDL